MSEITLSKVEVDALEKRLDRCGIYQDVNEPVKDMYRLIATIRVAWNQDSTAVEVIHELSTTNDTLRASNEKLRAAMKDLLGNYECMRDQWGDDHLWKKWEDVAAYRAALAACEEG